MSPKAFFIKLAIGLAGLLVKQALGRLAQERAQKNKKEKDIFDDVLLIAQQHVQYLMDKDMKGLDKKAAALANTQIAVKSLGYDVKVGMINMAIEIAYNALAAVTPPEKNK